MNPSEYTIKRFESNNPELIKIIEEWEQHSIKQNWPNLIVAFGRFNLKDVPPSEWDDNIKMNKSYAFFKELGHKVADYFLAKGYKAVSMTTKSVLLPDLKSYSSFSVTDGITIECLTQIPKPKEVK